MSSLVPSKNIPVEIVDRHGVNFYRLKYQPQELWVAGVDVSRELGAKNPSSHAKDIFRNNQHWLEKHSKLIKIKRKDSSDEGSQDHPHEREVFREIRVYNEIGFNFFISRSNTKRGLDHLLTILEDYQQLKNQRSKNKPIDWQQARDESKKQRRTLTDAIQLFVEYAKDSGSKGANWYYKLITQKINKMLFDVNGKGTPGNFREKLLPNELKILAIVEDQVAEYLLSCMNLDRPYKDIASGFDSILCNGKQVLDFKIEGLLALS